MRILKSYGTDGGVLVNSSEIPEGINLNEPATIVFDGLPVPFFIEEIRDKGSRAVIKFEDVDSLAQAEELVGKDAAFACESNAIQPDDGNYHVSSKPASSSKADTAGKPGHSDRSNPDLEALIGFSIINAADGSVFGVVSNYYDIPGNVCLCVMHNGSEVLVPLHEDLIRKFSRRSKSITLEIPNGLA
jgi:16S rRNA processing protein RimM